jgi:hypothetical protein
MHDWLYSILGAAAVWLCVEIFGEIAIELAARTLAPLTRPVRHVLTEPVRQVLTNWFRRARTPLPLLGIWATASGVTVWGYRVLSGASQAFSPETGLILFFAMPLLAVLLTHEWLRARRDEVRAASSGRL